MVPKGFVSDWSTKSDDTIRVNDQQNVVAGRSVHLSLFAVHKAHIRCPKLIKKANSISLIGSKNTLSATELSNERFDLHEKLEYSRRESNHIWENQTSATKEPVISEIVDISYNIFDGRKIHLSKVISK